MKLFCLLLLVCLIELEIKQFNRLCRLNRYQKLAIRIRPHEKNKGLFLNQGCKLHISNEIKIEIQEDKSNCLLTEVDYFNWYFD